MKKIIINLLHTKQNILTFVFISMGIFAFSVGYSQIRTNTSFNHPKNNQRNNPPSNQGKISHSNNRVWIPGYWQNPGGRSRKRWIPGHWEVRVIPAPCPTPVQPYPQNCLYSTLSAREMNDIIYTLRNCVHESARITTAQNIIQGNCLTSAQILDIMLQFSFENSRLEIAKFAWLNSVDPQRYNIVYQALNYETSIQELEAHIHRYRRFN